MRSERFAVFCLMVSVSNVVQLLTNLEAEIPKCINPRRDQATIVMG